MKELDDVLGAHTSAERDGDSCMLATLVKVDGSSYRAVGARMLVTSRGLRAGSVSGGCLEAEIAKKGWWLAANGARVQRYSTAGDGDSGLPFGMGCNGTLSVLLQRVDSELADLLFRLHQLRVSRKRIAFATVLNGPHTGTQRLYPDDQLDSTSTSGLLHSPEISTALRRVADQGRSEYLVVEETDILIEWLPPQQRLIVFGAGEDVRPLVQIARPLGWHITVADGRAHMATRERFPEATSVLSAPAEQLPSLCDVSDEDAVVLMTHSYPQDQQLLGQLIERPLRYLGLLGPRYRTRRLLIDLFGEEQLPRIQKRLHAPIGLNIGAHTPETIALAIVAEIQAVIGASERITKSSTLDRESSEALA